MEVPVRYRGDGALSFAYHCFLLPFQENSEPSASLGCAELGKTLGSLEENHSKNLCKNVVPLIPSPFPQADHMAVGTRDVYKWPSSPWAVKREGPGL